MHEVRWVKAITDIFKSDIISIIGAMPNADSVIYVLFRLLSRTRGKCDDGMFSVKVADRVCMDDQTVAVLVQRDIGVVSGALKTLEDLQVIKREFNTIKILPFWEDTRDRNSPQYDGWRRCVFERDNYTCVKCGSHKDLQAHHIVSWKDSSTERELRYSVNNGKTLCRKCHLAEHGGSWRGRKANVRENNN